MESVYNRNLRRKRLQQIMVLYAQKLGIDSRQRHILLAIALYWKLQSRRENVSKVTRRWWIRPINQNRAKQGDGEHLIDEMRLLDTESHFKYCRMTVEVFDNLLAIVKPAIKKQKTNFREPICPRTRLYLTLR